MTDITPAQLAELEALERASTDALSASVTYRYVDALMAAAPSLFAALRAAWARIEELECADTANETCEGCAEPATKRDVDGVPLCAECYSDCARHDAGGRADE